MPGFLQDDEEQNQIGAQQPGRPQVLGDQQNPGMMPTNPSAPNSSQFTGLLAQKFPGGTPAPAAPGAPPTQQSATAMGAAAPQQSTTTMGAAPPAPAQPAGMTPGQQTAQPAPGQQQPGQVSPQTRQQNSQMQRRYYGE